MVKLIPFLISISILAVPAQSAEGLSSDDPTLRPYQLRVGTYIDRCKSEEISNVETSECLYDQVKALKGLLKEEISKIRKSNVDAAKDKGNFGGDEKTTLKSLQLDFSKSQIAWEKYTNVHCGTIANRYELLGGTGGAVDGNRCAIRHLVQRINELRG